MKKLTIIAMLVTFQASAQQTRVTESVELESQTSLDLEFTFADQIVFKTWDKNEVKLVVDVEINDGDDNDAFKLKIRKFASSIKIEVDEDTWEKADRKEEWGRRGKNKTYNIDTDIDYTVYVPKGMEIEANTISGDYEFEYFGSPVRLKTISGEIDVTVPSKESLDFEAKTLSGEVYTDLDISFPYGKEGLRQIVGQKVHGRIKDGGKESEFETISGDIFLRKE